MTDSETTNYVMNQIQELEDHNKKLGVLLDERKVMIEEALELVRKANNRIAELEAENRRLIGGLN